YFRSAADAHLKAIFPKRIIGLKPPLKVFDSVAQLVLAQTQPRVALVALARSAITTGDNLLPPTAPGVTAVGVESIMAGPGVGRGVVRAVARSLTGSSAARSRERRSRHRARHEDEPAIRRLVPRWTQSRDGARAPLARVSDRSARHILRALLGIRQSEHGAGG